MTTGSMDYIQGWYFILLSPTEPRIIYFWILSRDFIWNVFAEINIYQITLNMHAEIHASLHIKCQLFLYESNQNYKGQQLLVELSNIKHESFTVLIFLYTGRWTDWQKRENMAKKVDATLHCECIKNF
jgi:hypothetical protein